jgi:hypothetical protein
MFGLVWQHVQATRLGYQVERSRRHILALRAANGELQMELETALAPARLSSEARGRMGMAWAAPESVRLLVPASTGERHRGLIGRLIARTWRVLAGPTHA